jgi:NitT/TauT family transport system permease protein
MLAGSEGRGRSRPAWHRGAIDRATHVVVAVVAGVLLVLFWDWAVVEFAISPAIFPRPAAVWQSLTLNVLDGTFIRDLQTTLTEVGIGFVGGSVLGFLLALAISEIKVIRMVLYPYLIGFQAIPKTALAPMFLIWFGFGLESKVALVISAVFFPVLINTLAGLQRADPDQLEMMRAYCGRPWKVFLRVKLPSALPLVFAGLELAIVLSMITAVVAEFLGALGGLGYRILTFNTNLDMAGQFAAIAVLSGTGYLLHFIVHAIGQRIVFWGRAKQGSGN